MRDAEHYFIEKQKELFVIITATRLLWNHSPSEWFSLYKNAPAGTRVSAGGLRFLFDFCVSARHRPGAHTRRAPAARTALFRRTEHCSF
jgi:hypothetical protein